ncbi:hypothetical protein [Pseudaminobacter sp. NGMCC 1.201702]|uniref:hypothetical protein n=1 Tax=Pseudaminobacter sp. NGMCC 1.201702 TaxID=3391825 RepID=UPI0039EE4722
MRIAMTTAIVLSLASPVLADCGEELSKLEQAAVTAETGASTEMPATKHQEEVLSGKQQTESKETTGAISGEVEAVSPHQKQVTGEAADKSGDIGQMMADARRLADAGDEQGCMSKVGELKDAMGIK